MSDPPDFEHIGGGALKKLSLDEIAETIATALSAKTGQTLKVWISRINFGGTGAAEFTLTVNSKPDDQVIF